MTVLSVTALIAFCILFWIFLGYPAVLWFVTYRKKRQGLSLSFHPPKLSLLVPVFNEEVVIEKKIENINQLTYPRDRLEVMLVDSGSTDRTRSIVRNLAPYIRIVEAGYKIGKARAINTAIPMTTGDLVVVTDANAFMKPDVLERVARCFADPSVGAATGAMRQVDRSHNAVSEGGGLYWALETFMRTRESAMHSVVAMSGEISAFRKSLFVDERNAIVPWYRPGGTDDFEMTLWVIRHGMRVAYAPDASVWEFAPDTIRDFFKQKVRIIVQTIVSVRRNLDLLFRSGSYGLLTFFSRKVLPLLAPWALLLLYTCSGILAFHSWWWAAIFLAQSIGYALAVLALKSLARWPLARLALFFVLLNATVLLAWMEVWRGKDYTSWEPIASSRRLS